MTTPFTIPHTAQDINDAIDKVVTKQTSGVLASDSNLATNTVIKNYIDDSIVNAVADYPISVIGYQDITTTQTSSFTLGNISESDSYNLTTIFVSTNGDDDGVTITNPGTYFIGFTTSVTQSDTLVQLWIDDVIYYEADFNSYNNDTYPANYNVKAGQAGSVSYTQTNGGSVVRLKYVVNSNDPVEDVEDTVLTIFKQG
jgi:hypothetical protein